MNILVVYYSMCGHVFQLARAVEQGAKSVAGSDVQLRRVAEFDEVIKKHLGLCATKARGGSPYGASTIAGLR